MGWLKRELEALDEGCGAEREYSGYLLRMRRSTRRYMVTVYGPDSEGERKRLFSGSGISPGVTEDVFLAVLEYKIEGNSKLVVLWSPPPLPALERVVRGDIC